jgi:probable HAF family extracellular repeat protein
LGIGIKNIFTVLIFSSLFSIILTVSNPLEDVFAIEVTKLSDIGGCDSPGDAWAINSKGQIACSGPNSDGKSRAFVFDTITGTLTELPPLDPLGNCNGSDINDVGQVAGWCGISGVGEHAALWDLSSGTVTDLGTLGGESRAFAVNNLGQVVGFSYDATDQPRAFLWEDPSTGMQDLGVLGGGSFPFSFARGINDAGKIVGTSTFGTTGRTHVFLYDSGLMTDLGNPPGASSAQGNNINELDQIVGYFVVFPSSTPRAFFYDSGVYTELSGLGGSTVPYSINNLGQIVGVSVDQNSIPRAVLWDSKDAPPQILSSFYNMAVWANDINDATQIVGWEQAPVPPGERGSPAVPLLWGEFSFDITGFDDITVTIDPDGNRVITGSDSAGETLIEITLPPGTTFPSGTFTIDYDESGANAFVDVTGLDVPYPPGKSIMIKSNPGSNFVCIVDEPILVSAGTLPNCGSTNTSISQVILECNGETQTFTGFPDDPTLRDYTCNKSTIGTQEYMTVDGLAFSFMSPLSPTPEPEKNNPCDALEKASENGKGKKKGLERAKANNDCS